MENYFRPVLPVGIDTETLRKKLEKDIAEFLAKGGVIEKLAPGERSTPMIEQRRDLNRAQIRSLLAKKLAEHRTRHIEPDDDVEDPEDA